MNTILCYGDSNTWGWNPTNKCRYSVYERWSGVLRNELGKNYYVIEEGLNGRTTVWDDPIMGNRSGMEYLLPCLDSHKPLDLVIIMLGTNDLKKRFSLSPLDIAKGIETLVKVVNHSECGINGTKPQVLIICPPSVGKLNVDFSQMFEGSEVKSKNLAKHYKSVAELYGCHFINAGDIIVSSDIDGIHLEKDEHRKLGLAVADIIKEILRNKG